MYAKKIVKNIQCLSMYDHSDVTNKRKQNTEHKTETGRNVPVI